MAMTAVRILFPSMTVSVKNKEWEGGAFQEFAEATLPVPPCPYIPIYIYIHIYIYIYIYR